MPYGLAEDYQSDEKAAKLVFDFVEKAEQAWDPLFKQWRRNELLYWSKLDADMWKNAMGASQWHSGSPYKSSLCLPLVLQQVETQVPKLATSLLANDPLFKALPLIRDGEMGQQAEAWMQAEAKERWLHQQCVRDVKIRRRLSPWLRSAVLHGTKILFADWVTRRGVDWSMVEKKTKASNGLDVGTGVWELTKGQKGELLEDRIRVTGHNLWDVLTDWRGQTFRSEDGRVCRMVVRKLIIDIDDLIGWIKGMPAKNWWFKRKKDGKAKKAPADTVWIKDLKELQNQVKDDDNKTASIMADVGRLSSDQGYAGTATEKDKKLICVYDAWEPVGGWHLMVAGRKSNGLCMLREPNPLKKVGLPFIAMCPVPLDNQIYGLGIVDMAEHLIHEANALTNLHMTGAIHEANPLVILDAMSGLSPDELMANPYLFHTVDGTVPPKDCVFIQPFPATSAAVFQEREFVLKQGEAAMGASEFSMTGDPGKNVTARGIQQFVQQNAQRFTQGSLQTGECLCVLGEVMDLLNQQFITGPRQLRYATLKGQGKPRFMSITPEMIKRPVDLEFDARPEVANPDLRAQQFLQYLGAVGQAPNFDWDEGIVEGAELLRIPRPPRFLKAQVSRAEQENEMFRQSVKQGQPYFGQVMPNDPHPEHVKIHGLVFEDGTVEAGGESAKRVAVEHLVRHMQLDMGAGGPQQEQEAEVG